MAPKKRSQDDTTSVLRSLDTEDSDPEIHVELFLARLNRDLSMMYNSINTISQESAEHAVTVLDNLLATLQSHSRTATVLKSHLQEKHRRTKVGRG